MKKSITLPKMTALAVLLVTFATASASFGGDENCKARCCKERKEVAAALATIEKAMTNLETELNGFSIAVASSPDIKSSLNKIRKFRIMPGQAFAFASFYEVKETAGVDAKSKINFNNLSREMDQVQEGMTVSPEVSQKINFCDLNKEMDLVQEQLSQMDESLRSEESANRKAADNVLKTGIKY